MFTSCLIRATFPLIALGLLLFSSIRTVYSEESNDGWNITTMDRLRVQLFTNYDKTAHPMVTPTQRTNITVGISVHYLDINELEGKLTLHGWARLQWMDGGRTWKPEYFDNITSLQVRAKEVWKPAVTLFNSAGNDGDYVGDTAVILSHDGSYLWVPPVVYAAYCNLNLRMWPYDTQTCKLKIGTWSLTTLDPREKNSLYLDDFILSTEWTIVNTETTYGNEEFYNYAEFSFTLKRCSSMFSAVIFTPASCIILLCLSVFWLPPQMGEKILLNAVLIVIISAFLMYFAQMLPILAENTPLIVLFYSSSLLLISLSTIISVIVLYLSTAKHKQRVPEFLKKLLNGNVGHFLLLSQFALEAEPHSLLNNGTKELGEHGYENPEHVEAFTDPTMLNTPTSPSMRSLQFDWVLLATAFDRIWFLVYCLMFSILAIVYSV
ncbi:neuronal acetylcholine receptor subunit alpha-2-like [Haematobia irritans]|uniref:neuronal acetylcholine receptor subunit alpha-2-like n=1 Tax=Haematobia irritans TaxID=7368 RepID=UPI003F5057F1